jgi:hypothetical protein
MPAHRETGTGAREREERRGSKRRIEEDILTQTRVAARIR